MIKTYWEAVKGRRSIYGLGNQPAVSEARIEEIMADTLKTMPSPYNSQSTRLLLLFGEAHAQLWQLTLDTLRAVTKPERFIKTEEKVKKSFASGYGTVLFFIDNGVVEGLIERFPKFAEKFTLWSQHSCAMHQYVIWTALEAEGLGASLQHYNPLIDEPVRKKWNVPENWLLVAQMPFGNVTEPPGEKEVLDVAPRLKIYR